MGHGKSASGEPNFVGDLKSVGNKEEETFFTFMSSVEEVN